MMRDTTIKPGEKFTSVGIPRAVWVVVREANLAQAIPPHYQLAHAKTRSRTIMMSRSALLDTNLFKRVEDYGNAPLSRTPGPPMS